MDSPSTKQEHVYGFADLEGQAGKKRHIGIGDLCGDYLLPSPPRKMASRDVLVVGRASPYYRGGLH